MDNDLIGLEQRINTLITECRRLLKENKEVREERDAVLKKREQLIEKNRIARTRLETMVHRLRTWDRDTSTL